MTVADALPHEAVETGTAAPRAPGRGKRALGWVALALLVVLGALFALRIAVSVPEANGRLDPASTAPGGASALAELLRGQGVRVDVTTSRTEAQSLLTSGSTLALADPWSLSDDAATELLESADRSVLLSSSARMLRLLEIGDDSSGVIAETEAACDEPAFANVGTIEPGRLFVPADGVTACFTDGQEGAAVLTDERDGAHTTLIDGTALLTNETLAEHGNAALGLALLGQTDHVIWYVPTIGDSDVQSTAPDTIGTLTPEWVTPAISLLLLVGLAAAIWRGRRFGPLVAENLPVSVRASETMHGRARLTAKAADAPHASEALRDGSVRRLAKRLGLSERASAEAVADAAADRLRTSRTSIRALLAGETPRTDTELIEHARGLAELETAVDAAVQAERRRL